jgi:N-acetylglucosaminyldiphosphoundecaprenol N-acetyl-beta-D-mannosaminyltransferase
MKFKLKELIICGSRADLASVANGKKIINTINAHSYNTALKDELFAEALVNGDVLIPDGASIVMACKLLRAKSRPTERIAGWDLFVHEMGKLNVESLGLRGEGDSSRAQNVESLELSVEGDSSQAQNDKADDNGNDDGNVDGLGLSVKGDSSQAQNDRTGDDGSVKGRRKKRVMFMGSSEKVLALIRERAAVDYPNLEVVTFSPPYKPEFSDEDNKRIIDAINDANPDLLWIGMTAPKQEKWVYVHRDSLNVNCHIGTIGAVFDFYAGTVKRAPLWWQRHGLEWLYRLLKEPKRMWRRYLVGNVLFLWNILTKG